MNKGPLTCIAGIAGVQGADERTVVPCRDPADTWELPAHQRLANSWPQTRPLQSQFWGKTDSACFLEKPTGSRLVPREVLLTVTFPLQGCLVLPRTPGSSPAWLCPGCVSTWPKGHDAALAGAVMSGAAASTFVFSFHLPAKSLPCLCLLKLKARNVDLEDRCLSLPYSRSPVWLAPRPAAP